MTHRELESLIQAAHDGTLAEADAHRLRERLRESPDAIGLWCDYALLTQDLRNHIAAEARRPGALTHAGAYLAGHQKRRQATLSMAAAAAVVMIAALLLARVIIPPADTDLTFVTSPGTMLVGTGDADPADGRLGPGREIHLRQGLAELRLPGGVEGILEGPARLRFVNSGHVEIPVGRARFKVPPGGAGFTVVGRQMTAVDLGTDFGVDFREGVPASVSVLEGAVEARARGGHRATLRLTAGQAAELTPVGDFRRLESVHSYPGSLPDRLPFLLFGFDSLTGDTTPVSGNLAGAERLSARLIRGKNAAPALVPGIRGSALRLDGGTELVTDWPGIHGSSPRTVHLWVRPDPEAGYAAAPPLALWGSPSDFGNRKFKLALVDDGPGSPIVPRVSLGDWFADGEARLRPDAWHHLAVVWNGNDDSGRPDIRLYVDGRPTGLEVRGGPLDHPPATEIRRHSSRPLSLGRYELRPDAGDAYFRGTIDELHIVAGALDPAEIAVLATR